MCVNSLLRTIQYSHVKYGQNRCNFERSPRRLKFVQVSGLYEGGWDFPRPTQTNTHVCCTPGPGKQGFKLCKALVDSICMWLLRVPNMSRAYTSTQQVEHLFYASSHVSYLRWVIPRITTICPLRMFLDAVGCRMMMIFVFRNPQPVAFRFAAKSRTLGSLIDIFGGSRESAGCGIWKARRNSAWGFDNRPDFILVGGGYWKIPAQIHAAGMCEGIPIILSIWVGKFVCYANSRGMRWSWNGYWKGISKFSLGFWEKIKNILYNLEADTP